MSMDKELLYYSLSEKEKEIEERVMKILKSHAPTAFSEASAKLAASSEETRLSIAFVGQHNAGKSTIISALTGNRQIKISSNVETDTTEKYSWGDVVLYDTPGLFAGVKTSHDEAAYKAIEESDLIVFCLTSSLFDDCLIGDFISLAYRRSYRNKIILVVNKMSQEDGEFGELEDNYRATLSRTLEEQGGHLGDFPIAFIDAKDYREGAEDEDEELIELSNFKSFIELLNEQISRKGLTAKLLTKFTILSDTISSVLSEAGSVTDKNMTAVLSRLERTVRNYKRDMRYTMLGKESKLRTEIINIGDGLTSVIGEHEITDDDINDVNIRIKRATDDAIDDIEKELTQVNDQLLDELGDVLSTDMAIYVFKDINSERYLSDSLAAVDFNNFIKKYASYKKMIRNGGDAISKLGFGNVTGEKGELALSGGATLSQAVIQMSYYFGKAFKPTELVGLTGKLAKVGKVVGPVMAAMDVALVIADKAVEESKLREIQEARKKCFNAVSAVASDIIGELEKQYSLMEDEVFGAKIKELSDIRTKLVTEVRSGTELANELKECYSIINDIIENPVI